MGYKTVPRTLKLAVPAGIGDQQLLRIPGQGNMGGDLMVKVSIEPNKWFVRKELDVYSSVAVSGQTMEYGGLIRILTVHGPATECRGCRHSKPRATITSPSLNERRTDPYVI